MRELRRARPLLGTIVEITVPDRKCACAAIERAFAVIARVQALMSAHDESSDLGRLHRARIGVPVSVHPWTWRVLAKARAIGRRTGGAFDPVVAGRLAVANGGLPPWRGSARGGDARFADLELLGEDRVRLRRRLRIDLGGIAKGFAVDRAVAVLRAARLEFGLVNAGGDLRAFGPRAWPVHVRHPGAPGCLVSLGSLRNGAVATSAPYFSEVRASGRRVVSALIDPTDGRCITGAISATVFARTCLAADALAKAVLVRRRLPGRRGARARAMILTAPEGGCDVI